MRKGAIKKLLDEVSEIIEILKNDERKAFSDEKVMELSSPKIKSALEHLRSCLDYSTHDISQILVNQYAKNGVSITLPKEKDIYFPYVLKLKDFKGRCNSVLKDLDTHMKNVYDLIESIQVYNTGKEWIINFIKLTNKIKHFDEKQQERQDFAAVSLGNGTIVVGGGSGVKVFNNVIDGRIQDKPLLIEKGRVTEMPTNIPVLGAETTAFVFQESKEHIVGHLTKAYDGVKEYIENLYALLEKY